MHRNDWYTPSRGRRIPVRRGSSSDRILQEKNRQLGRGSALNRPDNERGYHEQPPPVTGSTGKSGVNPSDSHSQPVDSNVIISQPIINGVYPDEGTQNRDNIESSSTTDLNWQAMALQMRADMDNYRQRQVRLAAETVEQEHYRLLKQILPVADNLQRALQYETQSDITLREGVALVLRQMMQTLENEGVSPINTTDAYFDPSLHEAVATTLANAETGTIIDEVEAGYTVNDRLLRPAKVVVAT